MNKELFEEVVIWQKETFGQATPLSKLAHLQEEVEELIDDLKSNNPKRRLEFADCFLLLFGAAGADDMSYQDITDCINEKLAINKTRKWGKPNADGVVNHIKD